MTCVDAPAFYEVRGGKEVFEGLCEHSLRTAAAGLALFEDELEVHGLVGEFVIAALLHDVGKANDDVLRRYEILKNSKLEGKLSFKCHEVLSAQVVLELGPQLRGAGLEHEAIFYAVLRHHHAMRMLEECKHFNAPLGDVGLLGNLMPELKELKGLKVKLESIEGEARSLGNQLPTLAKGFVLAGFLSLADSVAAALARRADSAQKPSGYVRRALEERGKTLEDVEKEIERELPKVYGIVKEVSKDTGLSTCSSCSTSKAYP